MYSVSEDFLEALQKHTRVEHIRGSIGTALFNDSNVLSMTLSNRCSDTSDITFGSAYVGQLQAAFINVNIPRGEWGGKEITLQWGVVTEEATDEDPEVVEWIPVGKFTIASAEWTDTGVKIVANDNMEKLDKDFIAQTGGGYIYDYASYACSSCGVAFALTRAECEDLPNGDQLLGLYPENDIKTFRDLMSWVAQTVGGFVTADRTGAITIRSFADSAEVDEWTSSERVMGSVFSDYTTYYDGISIVNIEDRTLTYYSAEGATGYGAVIKLGSNPLMQYGLDEVKEAQRMTLANLAHSMEWTPFKTSTLSSLVYDLGDLITCSDGVAGSEDLTCCVQAYDWTFKNTTAFTGYGADPRLASGQSKTDKNLSGLLSRIDSESITYYQFKNVDSITIDEDDETTLASIKFAAQKKTDVDIWLEAKLDVSRILTTVQVPVWNEEEVIDPETGEPVIDPDTGEPETEIVQIGWWNNGSDGEAVATVKYYYDNILVGYEPVETWNEDGLHTIHYGYFLPSVSETQNHTFKATITIDGAEAEIDINDATMVLRGQALAGSDYWDGEITLEDETGYYDISAMSVGTVEEGTPSVNLTTVLAVSATDTVGKPDMDSLSVKDTEDGSLSVVLRNIVFGLITEDGLYNIVSADGNYIITTED